ncbi:hypothetical protein [Stenotrophomonas sp. B1-1]|uniref:hypothetical protein n=1 Tax=Stenotrophomonas sp. B1-1 TaxID=2710648 RepID=UPI0013DAA361|nr:hypothetical protein [Stenotrophomonas sp. B1-1]
MNGASINDLVIGGLILLLAIGLANLLIGVLLWWRHVGLVARVTRLEVYREQALTHTDVRQVYERLSSMEGQLQTTNRLLQTVQQHLLENE